MRKSYTAVIERNQVYTESFATEPYEAAWAGEARWFVQLLDVTGEEPALTIQPQLSPDGLHWCQEESQPLVLREPGLYTLKLRDFGGWLRLECRLGSQTTSAKVLIHLALKE